MAKVVNPMVAQVGDRVDFVHPSRRRIAGTVRSVSDGRTGRQLVVHVHAAKDGRVVRSETVHVQA